jgi:hypothetical protein
MAAETTKSDVKMLPPVGETGRPPAPNPDPARAVAVPVPTSGTPVTLAPSAGTTALATTATPTPPPRQLSELPPDELAMLAEEYGLDPRRFKTPQETVSAIHGRRQLIASIDREAMLDVVRWGRRPVPINAGAEQLAHEVMRIRRMRFDGLSERGLVALARLRGVEISGGEGVPALVKRLKKQEGLFARINRKRRAWLGAIVSNMIGESDEKGAEVQALPPSDRAGTRPAAGSAAANPGAGASASASSRDRTIKEEIEESGLFGGIASRVKKTADQYINQKLDEIESRIDRKLDEIDRRLAEWRDKEIANRLRILKITLWASVIVAVVSLIYSYIKVNYPGLFWK